MQSKALSPSNPVPHVILDSVKRRTPRLSLPTLVCLFLLSEVRALSTSRTSTSSKRVVVHQAAPSCRCLGGVMEISPRSCNPFRASEMIGLGQVTTLPWVPTSLAQAAQSLPIGKRAALSHFIKKPLFALCHAAAFR